jgi:hypothetical protein
LIRESLGIGTILKLATEWFYKRWSLVLSGLKQCDYFSGNRKVAMALIKLRKANESGEEVGVVIVNTDQIVAIAAGQSTTELQMVDGRIRWVKETLDEVAALARMPT